MKRTPETVAMARAWKWPADPARKRGTSPKKNTTKGTYTTRSVAKASKDPAGSIDFSAMLPDQVAAALGATPLQVANWAEAGAPVRPDGTFDLPSLVRWHERGAVSMAVSTILEVLRR
jgi:hypothetical protein